jgi:hypothetical protein
LRITRITCTSEDATAEVPLSYTLLEKYGFLDVRYAKFDVAVNGDNSSSACRRGNNGDCLLSFDKDALRPGTNQIQTVFIISSRTNTDFIMATGPATEFIWTNGVHQTHE